LAPLAAIPLIGSAALTTFTALFATGGYGKRRKRDLVTRELLTGSFSKPTPKDQYMHQTLIASRDTDQSFPNFHKTINVDESRQTFPLNDQIWSGIDSNPKSQSIRVRVEDDNSWKASDFGRNAKRDADMWPLIHNKSEDIAHQSVSTRVKVLEKPYKQTISSSYRQSKGNLDKRDQEESIQKQQYKISLQKSPYRTKTDFGPDLIFNNNNDGVNDSKRKNMHKIYTNLKDVSDSMRFEDLSSEASETMTRMIEPKSENSQSAKQDNNEKSDRSDFNTWIPFLSSPYLVSKHF